MKFTSRVVMFAAAVALLIGVQANASALPSALQGTPAATAAAVTFPLTVKDGAGTSVIIAAKPVHIVSATLGTDEILFGLVNPSRLASITANADDPQESNIVSLAPQVKTHLAKVDPEAIIAMHPDLIFVASYTDAAVVKQLRDAKLSVFEVASFNSVKDIESNILQIGQTVGEMDKAQKLVDSMEARLTTISTAIKGAAPVTAIYYAPGDASGGYSDGPGTLVDDIITRAGGTNAIVAGGIKDQFPQISDEEVIKLDPAYILLSGFTSIAPGYVDAFLKNPKFQTLSAIKNKHVVVVNDAHMTAVSQYVVEGVADVAALLHPDLFTVTPAPTTTVAATMGS